MKLYNLKNLVVVSIKGHNIICQKFDESSILSEVFTGSPIFYEEALGIKPLNCKFYSPNADKFCLLGEDQLADYYLRLNETEMLNFEGLLEKMTNVLSEYYCDYLVNSSAKEIMESKKELLKTCASCVNNNCPTQNLKSDNSCNAWENPAMIGENIVRKLNRSR